MNKKLNFYCPLEVTTFTYFDEEWGGYLEDNESFKVIDEERYFDEIKDTIDNYYKEMVTWAKESSVESNVEKTGLIEYYDVENSVKEKVLSAVPTVELVNLNGEEQMLGVCKCEIKEDLTPFEINELRSYIGGQFSDGFGEGFEQQEIETDEEKIYVSLWNAGRNYFLKTGEELGIEEKNELQNNNDLSKIITDTENQKNENQKPDCALIGEDGNVFNLIGIASKTLKQNGLDEQAKEMTDRVFVSHSYNDALSIISEYVNVVDKNEVQNNNGFTQQM